MVVAVACHTYVALLAPLDAPAVLHDPIVAVLRVLTVSDHKYPMIQLLRATILLIVDAWKNI